MKMAKPSAQQIAVAAVAALVGGARSEELEATLAEYAEEVLEKLKRIRAEMERVAGAQSPGAVFSVDHDTTLELFIGFLRGKKYREPLPK